MVKKITPEKAIAFTKLMVAITYCWPLPPTASRGELIRFKITRGLCVLSALLVLLPLVNAIYSFIDDPLTAVKLVCLTCATVQIPIQTILCAGHYKTLQSLIVEVQEFIGTAEPWKREILQQYTDRCARFYAGVMLWFYFNATFIAIGPAILPNQKFPTDAKYPFSIDFWPLKIALYVHQSFVLQQCAAQVSVNAFIALLLWFSAARFEILSTELRNIATISDLYACIETHQFMLRYTDNVRRTVRFLSLSAVILSFTSLVFNGLTLLVVSTPTSPDAKIQFGLLSATALLEVFMLSWPADNLMNVSTQIAEGAYGAKWYELSQDIRKTLIYLILRARKPVAVSIGGILPPMSLKYFASYLSTAFSYFTTLRILIENAD